jgi:beta-glucosidase
MKKYLLLILIVTGTVSFAQYSDPKMNNFIAGLMAKMTLEEKIGQLNLVTPGWGIPTGSVVSQGVEDNIRKGRVGGLFGIHGPERIRKAQDLAVRESRLKIPLMFGSDVIHGHKTTFPIPLGLASSWDIPLIERLARIAATEASADGLNWAFSPMVDIARDPRWGRVAEGAGEDPYLGSLIAAAMVRGYQGNDLSKDNTLLACVKHFALYGASEAGRDYNTVDMSRWRMYNEYLPPYKAAVDAGVGSVMSSFNVVDGIPATGNRWLLTELLRNQWGFKGMVVSDYTSLSEMINHGMGDLQAVSALALKAGLDMDMVAEGLLNTLKKSLDEKKVAIRDIDLACRRVLEAKYRLGLFDDPYRYINESRPAKETLTAENRKAAREAATKSMVLLKNSNQLLPLKKSGTIALVGPLANDRNNMLGTWAVAGDPQLSVPVMTGMSQYLPEGSIRYAKGANITNDTSLAKKANVFGARVEIDARTPEQMIAEAVGQAQAADMVVAVVGEASEMSGEAASRSDITLPESQRTLLEALKKTGKPLVVVLLTGRPLAIPKELEMADALLLAWFAGTEAGNSIADVLFGTVNPSGKLPMSFPHHVGQVPVYYSQHPTGRPQDPNNKFSTKYLDVPNEALLPFGYGLSYTQFRYGNPSISGNRLTRTGKLTVSVNLSNMGGFDGEEVVQLFIRDKVRSVSPPVKELKGFQKIMLKKGESRVVTFEITESMLRFYNSDLKFVSEPGEFEVMVGGNSRDTQKLSFTLE